MVMDWEDSSSRIVTSAVDVENCFRYQKRRFNNQNTSIFLIALGYEGVPEIFLLNVCMSLVIILIFSILRKKAWHYGRLALLHHRRSRSAKRKYGYDVLQRILHEAKSSGSPKLKKRINKSIEETKLTSPISLEQSPEGSLASGQDNKISSVGSSGILTTGSSKSTSEQGKKSKSEKSKYLSSDRGLLGWIPFMFKLKDEQINEKCGADSVYYAYFQRSIIIYLAVITVIGLSILLPVHLTGKSVRSPGQHFAYSTIVNLDPDSDFLWFHCILLIFFTVLCTFFMRNFATKLPSMKEEQIVSAIMITDMSGEVVGNVDLVKQYFVEAYPNFKLTNVNFAYDVAEIKSCQVRLKNAVGALRAVRKTNNNPKMRISRFSSQKVLCSEYYAKNAEKFKGELAKLRKISKKTPLPICFVSFEHFAEAMHVLNCFVKTFCGPIKIPGDRLPHTSLNKRLRPNTWTVKVAPDPDDVLWENLSVKYFYLRSFTINVGVFLLLFFFSTPSYVFISLNQMSDYFKIKWEHSSVFHEGFAVVLLILFASLLPYIVSYGESRCDENLLVLRKVTIFLLFMILLFPSVSVLSARIFVELIFVNEANSTDSILWGCMFLPQNGAFFTNYVISSTWITVAMEFFRLTTLINYACRRLFARSKYERFHATFMTVWSFPFGDNYAWMLLIFTITIVYSVFFPLILPVGLSYFVFKYFVDRYNIFFAYTPGKISKEQHLVAMNFILFSFVLAQFILFLYLVTGTSLKKFRTLFVLVVLMFSFFGFAWHCVFGWIWYGVVASQPSRSDDSEKQFA